MSGLESGRLRHRLRIERPVYSQDPDTGEQTLNWELVGKVWAAVEPLSAREFIASQATQSEVRARVVIRYRDISPTWRFVHRKAGKDLIYNIAAGELSDKDSGLEYLTIPVSTGVNSGE